MTTIRVLRTGTKPYTHRIPAGTFAFKPNALGHLTCKIEDQSVIDTMLGYPGPSFAIYEQAEPVASPVIASVPVEPPVEPPKVEAASTQEPPAEPESPYVLRSGDTAIDLRELSDKQLFAFCKANNIEVNNQAKGNTIRDRIVQALAAPAGE